MSDEKQQIVDDGPARRYFHIMLNMADDDLNPFEYRLLGHYIRVGECWESVRTTAEKTQMGIGTVSKTRKSLNKKGYIRVRDHITGTKHITITDRWAENIARYVAECSPSEHDGDDVHVSNAGVRQANAGVRGVNERRTIEELTNEEEPTNNGRLVDARLALLSVPVSSTQWLEMSKAYDIELLVKKARWFDYAWRRGWAKGVNWLHAALQKGWDTPPKGFDEAKYLTDDERSQHWAEIADRLEDEQPEREYTVYTGQEAITRRWWGTAQSELALQLPRETYDTWLRHAQVVAVDGDAALTIGLHNIRAREWVQHRLDKVIRRTLARVAGHDVEVKYEVKA